MTLAMALTGGTALAQDTPSSRGYDETLGVIGQVDTPETPREESAPSQDEVQEATPTPAQPVEEEGNLPFTGLDIGIVALMGLALLGTGFALRRSTRGNSI